MVLAQAMDESAAIACGIVLFVLGFAHGAADEDGGAIAPLRLAQLPAYLAIGLAGVALFLASPLLALALFLLLSAWHFGTTRETGDVQTRIAVALLAIGGSALVQREETAGVFDAITGSGVPAVFMTGLAFLGAAGAVLAIYALIARKSGCIQAAGSLALVSLFHPVLAVGAIFLLAHALPVQRAQIARHGASNVRRAVRWATGGALLGTGALVAWVAISPAALPLAVALAMGMAIPHMLLDRVA